MSQLGNSNQRDTLNIDCSKFDPDKDCMCLEHKQSCCLYHSNSPSGTVTLSLVQSYLQDMNSLVDMKDNHWHLCHQY